MISALLNIIAIIAIIAVGAFIIVLFSDLVISIIDGKNGIFFKRGNKTKKEEELPERPKMVKYEIEEEKPAELETQEVPQLTHQEEKVEIKEEPKEEFDFSTFIQTQPKEEKVANKKSNEDYVDEITEISKAILEDEVEEDEEIETEAEDETPAEDVEALKKELEEQRKLIERLVAQQNEEDEAEDEVEEEQEEVEETVEDEEETEEVSNEEIEAMRKELEAQKIAYEKLLNEKENLQKTLEEQSQLAETVETEVKPMESIDELNARRQVLEERLKSNEKLLKANKKEFLPLYRIHKSLDSDTKKLRRKEASVAKQKVVLYGVNNYVDIDEEKAKELSEELDLLEGLRVSVKDAKAVMEANKERYPILEETNRILKQTIEDIKSDIAEVKSKIEMLNNANNTESDAE